MPFNNPYYNPSAPAYQMPTYQAQYSQPIQDRLAQLQNNYQNTVPQGMYAQTGQQQLPQMQYIQAPSMIGRFVNEFTDITANDVPMDGRWAIFAKNDMSEIQARAWSSDGKIIPVVFKPVIQEQPNMENQAESKIKVGLSDEATEAFMRRFDDISDRLEKMERSIARPSASKAKKEVETNE